VLINGSKNNPRKIQGFFYAHYDGSGGKMTIGVIAILLAAVVISLIIGWFANSYFGKRSLANLKHKAQEILDNATTESETLKKEKLLEAEEEYYNLKQKLEDEFRNKKISLQNLEQELNEKDTNIDRKADFISKRFGYI